jgi:hypothetical protein
MIARLIRREQKVTEKSYTIVPRPGQTVDDIVEGPNDPFWHEVNGRWIMDKQGTILAEIMEIKDISGDYDEDEIGWTEEELTPAQREQLEEKALLAGVFAEDEEEETK